VADGPAGFDIYNFDLLSGTNDNFSTNDYGLQVQPNPAKNKISISFDLPSSQYARIDLFNLEGQMIRSLYNSKLNEGQFGKTFDIANIPKGIYLLKVQLNEQVTTKKLVIY
jgi:hypothetical protein